MDKTLGAQQLRKQRRHPVRALRDQAARGSSRHHLPIAPAPRPTLRTRTATTGRLYPCAWSHPRRIAVEGLSEAEADQLAEHFAAQPDVMLEQLAAEEHLGSPDAGGNAWTATLAGFLSTAIGALVPVLPFFYARGFTALLWAGAVSLAAHFAVGAAKSLVTLRTWWSSGLEMTVAGVLMGALRTH